MAEKPRTTNPICAAGIDRRSLISGGAAAASVVALGAGKALGAAGSVHPDAELLELGRQWDAARQRLKDIAAQPDSEAREAEFEGAMEHCNDLTLEIFALRPLTIEGAKLQQRILDKGEAFDLYDAADGWALALIADLIEIAEGRA